jgi:predicted flap endonuclease-1-like 5' DNA nuclease
MHRHELAASQARTELAATREKMKTMARDLAELGGIRDRLQQEISIGENTLAKIRFQVTDLETEFEKSGVFYKGEISKSFEKRKTVETELDNLKAERESLTTLLDASKMENESMARALDTAHRRLDNLEAIERDAIKLEAENAQLRHDAIRLEQEFEFLKRDATEMDALKIQNRELSHCLKSMENSRRQYEQEARRYRSQAEQSEQLSDTLRLKLDGVEKNLADMAGQQGKAEKLVRNETVVRDLDEDSAEIEVDDLTRIIGIGKVFQHALNRLGFYSFRQLANFSPSDIARVNVALKENKGRMEQDDWIGQAKELYFQKYSEPVEH